MESSENEVNRMFRYIIKRLLLMIPILLGVLVILFTLSEITPGDPVDSLVATGATLEEREALRETLGLNDPVYVRFIKYVVGVCKGDLGTSYKTHQPVWSEVKLRLPYSLTITFSAVFLAVLTGVPIGILSALKQYTWIDNALLAICMFLLSIPQFCMGLFFIYLFSVRWSILPAFGITDWTGFILPILVVMLCCGSSYARISRSSMLEVMRQDYVKTARAKGQHERVVVFRHMLKNALIPIIASIGNDIGGQLGGALILETVFGVPGCGKYIADAIMSRNYPCVLGGVFVLAFLFSIINLIVDIVYVIVDPRLKTSIVIDTMKQRRKVGREAKAHG